MSQKVADSGECKQMLAYPHEDKNKSVSLIPQGVSLRPGKAVFEYV